MSRRIVFAVLSARAVGFPASAQTYYDDMVVGAGFESPGRGAQALAAVRYLSRFCGADAAGALRPLQLRVAAAGAGAADREAAQRVGGGTGDGTRPS